MVDNSPTIYYQPSLSLSLQVTTSFLNNPIPDQTMTSLRDSGFSVVPVEIEDAIVSLFGLGATVACEQANRASRNGAERESDHCKLSAERIMLLPYRNKVRFRNKDG